MSDLHPGKPFFNDIRAILQQARQKAYTAVNFAMVEAYWQIGKRIVQEEQHGEARAEYGNNGNFQSNSLLNLDGGSQKQTYGISGSFILPSLVRGVKG